MLLIYVLYVLCEVVCGLVFPHHWCCQHTPKGGQCAAVSHLAVFLLVENLAVLPYLQRCVHIQANSCPHSYAVSRPHCTRSHLRHMPNCVHSHFVLMYFPSEP